MNDLGPRYIPRYIRLSTRGRPAMQILLQDLTILLHLSIAACVRLDYFGSDACLAQSPQLYKQVCVRVFLS